MPSQTKKITFDTAALFFGKLVGLLLGIVRLNFLARFLGVAGFGILNFAAYYCSLFLVLFDFGISQLLTRELARDLSRSRELVGKTVLLKIGMVFVSSLFVGALTFISDFDRVTNWSVLLTTASIAINSVSMVFLSAFQAHRKMVLVSIANMANDLLLSIAIILVIQEFPFVITALILTVITSLVNLGILFAVYHRTVGMPEYRLDTALWKMLMKESAPIAVSSLGISTYTFIGPTVLKYTRGDVEVGIYSAGYKLISILTLIPTAFTQVVYPIFSDFYANAKEKLEKALADSLRVITIISVPLATGIIILTPKIFALLYSEEFNPGMIVLQLTIAGNIFGYMDWILYAFLLAINQQVFLMRLSAVTGLGVLTASILFVPFFGFVALPFITIVTELSLFIIQLGHLRKLGYTSFSLNHLLKPIFASLVLAGLLLTPIGVSAFVMLPFSALLYLGVIYLIRGLGEQEMTLLNGIIAGSTWDRS